MKRQSLGFIGFILFLSITIFTTSCKKEEDQPEIAGKSIAEIVSTDPNFSLLKKAVDKVGLASLLSSGNFTIFAPDNEAFASAGITEEAINSMPVKKLDSILQYHVLSGKYVSGAIPATGSIKTLLGINAYPLKNTDGIFLNMKKIKTPDLIATNGVIHVISSVLMPPTKISEIVSLDPDFSILKAAVIKAGLVDFLSGGSLTVFAPDNEAFKESGINEGTISSLPKEKVDSILKYHVLNTSVLSLEVPTTITGVNTVLNINLYAIRNADSSVSVNDIKVKKADIITANGVIHVISKVLMPATITDIVVLDPNFSILKAAVVRAGLADALKSGSLTVFAPDNAAFTASGIDETAINSLPVADLTNILLYHVVGAKVPSTGVPVSDTVKTLLTTNIYASKNANGVFVNGIDVKAADVQAANGVIHVISKVLIPPTKTIAELVSADPELSLLLTAVVRAGLDGAVSSPGKYTVFAPTNDAFVAAGLVDADAINAAPVDLVASIVKAHLFATNVFSSDLTEGATVPTLETGKSLVVGLTPPSVKIEASSNPASNIILTGVNITATNGVIHKIDRVLQ